MSNDNAEIPADKESDGEMSGKELDDESITEDVRNRAYCDGEIEDLIYKRTQRKT